MLGNRPDRTRACGAWRTTLPEGHRFEATQALRQVLNRVVDRGPARQRLLVDRRFRRERRAADRIRVELWDSLPGW
jgi:hypothetical protein